MTIMLIHPPLDDPTIPYHSTAYLAGHLRANGFCDVKLRDINIEYLDNAIKPETVSALYCEAESRLVALDSKRTLGYEDQEIYYGLLAARRLDPAEIAQAATALRHKDTFLDFSTYLKSMNTMTSYLAFLGALCYPSENRGFAQLARGRFSVACMKDLLNNSLLEQVCFPFTRYFYKHIVPDPEFQNASFFGVSIVYDHQIPHAFHFLNLLKKQWPEKQIVIGGTAVSQLYKYMVVKDKLKELFHVCDAIVIGEGETAICEIAAAKGKIRGAHFTNTITFCSESGKLEIPEIRYENVSSLGAPYYDYPWHLYLSPERGINYSPTRGCYWNRCTFCDYGLNTDRPTSPWRERSIPQVIEDIRGAQLAHGVNYVYFAVDVMAPGYLERLSDAIIDCGLNIRWAAELRMAKIFSLDLAQKMAKAGCVCVSFGMESGNQRILDIINKGTKVDYMAATMKNFADAGIACQLMAFTDFPTETAKEKETTYEFIRNTQEYWSTGGLSTFLLTGTSIIARNPEQFGITLIETKDADIRRAVAYRFESGTGQRMALTEDAEASFDEDGGIFPPVLGRPWAGGTDSLHTMIYYEKYGRNFFKDTDLNKVIEVETISDEEIPVFSLVVNGKLAKCKFDLSAILENRKSFLRYLEDRVAVPAEPTYSAFKEWTNTLSPIEPQEKSSYWLVLGRKCVKLDKLVYQILTVAAKNTLVIGEILASVPVSLKERLLDYLKGLETNGFVSYKHGDHVVKRTAKPDPEVVIYQTKQSRPKPSWRIEPMAVKNEDFESSEVGRAAQ
jgi:hypothetical protein